MPLPCCRTFRPAVSLAEGVLRLPSAESMLISDPARLGGLLPPWELALRPGVLPFRRCRGPLSAEPPRSPDTPDTEARPSGALRLVFSRTWTQAGVVTGRRRTDRQTSRQKSAGLLSTSAHQQTPDTPHNTSGMETAIHHPASPSQPHSQCARTATDLGDDPGGRHGAPVPVCADSH